jgi:hypothetical protein
MALSVGGYDAIVSSEAVKRIETKLEIEVGSIGKFAATVSHNVKAFHRFMTESSTDSTFDCALCC